MMGIDGFIKSVFKTVPAEVNFNAIAGALKNAYGIDMDYLNLEEGDQYILTLSKGGLRLRFSISGYEYKNGHYEQIIRENVDRFRKQLDDSALQRQIQDVVNRKVITMSGKNANILILDDEMNAALDAIVFDDLKKVKETEDVNIIRFSKEDLDAIQRMKEAVRRIGAPGMNPIIAGGFFASVYWHEEPRDIDLFYLEGDDENRIGFKIPPEENVTLTDEAGKYLKNPMITKVISLSVTKRQFIFTKYKTRRELIDHFDMLHCCVSYDVKEDKLYISPAALEAIKHKAIKSNGKNKIAQWRLDKMLSRGWRPE